MHLIVFSTFVFIPEERLNFILFKVTFLFVYFISYIVFLNIKVFMYIDATLGLSEKVSESNTLILARSVTSYINNLIIFYRYHANSSSSNIFTFSAYFFEVIVKISSFFRCDIFSWSLICLLLCLILIWSQTDLLHQ